jgi:hypothetical protein
VDSSGSGVYGTLYAFWLNMQESYPKIRESKALHETETWVEDLMMCWALGQALLPSDSPQVVIFKEKEFQGFWVHSGKIKDVKEYERCHELSKTCHGEHMTQFSHPPFYIQEKNETFSVHSPFLVERNDTKWRNDTP